MDFISDIRKQVNSYQSTDDKYTSSNFSKSGTTTSIRMEEVSTPTPQVKNSLDFFLKELENRNFLNNKAKEQKRLVDLENVREEVVTKLKELHIENKLNPAFIKELLSAIEVTYKKFKDDTTADPINFYNACLSYIDSRRPQISDYKSHVDF